VPQHADVLPKSSQTIEKKKPSFAIKRNQIMPKSVMVAVKNSQLAVNHTVM
jgi:hypothetical protein